MVSMPSAIASLGVRSWTSLPSMKIWPAVGRMGAGEHLDQRRLAGAVVANKTDDLARLGVEVDVAQRMNAAVPFFETDAADQCIGARLDEAIPRQAVLMEDLAQARAPSACAGRGCAPRY